MVRSPVVVVEIVSEAAFCLIREGCRAKIERHFPRIGSLLRKSVGQSPYEFLSKLQKNSSRRLTDLPPPALA